MSFKLNIDQFVHQFIEYFQKSGWISTHDKHEDYWEISHDFHGSNVGFVFNSRSVFAPTLNPKVQISPFLTNAAFSKIEKEIFQHASKIQVDPAVAYTKIIKSIPEYSAEYPVLFKDILQEIEAWGQNLNLQNCVQELATKGIPEVGGGQLRHLTALAYLGDFNTLLDYQKIFRKGKRLNFVPMITAEIIDRAIDIAAERA
ncbi:DUF6990 domain-containing protein [Rhizobium sp. BR 314]|uniref:DUF6990 domain-containing protein n=1 Tax=Rhizobium sp. BR 314 TaxID=3040013 RepID=UPI0039BFB66C